MLYTKVLRRDSSERVREPEKKKPLEKRYGRREQARSLGQGDCERRRESDSDPEELAASVERCVYTRLSIYITGGRGRRVGVRAKGWKGGTYFIFMGICRYCALAPTTCGRELTDLPLSPPSVSPSPPRSFSLSPSPSPPSDTSDIFCCASVASPSFFLACPPLPSPSWSPQLQDAQPAAGPCVISGAIPYSVSTMICSRLVPRSRWISFIGVRVCPTSIYRRGVSWTGYSQRYKDPEETGHWQERCTYVQIFRVVCENPRLDINM